MLKKSERLTKAQFDQYFKIGKRFHFSHYTIIYSPHDTLHAAVVVGKKVAKKATDRNQLRRRLYAQLYWRVKQQGRVGVFIVLVKPSAIAAARKQLQRAFTTDIAEVLKKT